MQALSIEQRATQQHEIDCEQRAGGRYVVTVLHRHTSEPIRSDRARDERHVFGLVEHSRTVYPWGRVDVVDAVTGATIAAFE